MQDFAHSWSDENTDAVGRYKAIVKRRMIVDDSR